MKRFVLTVVATIAGVVALLGLKAVPGPEPAVPPPVVVPAPTTPVTTAPAPAPATPATPASPAPDPAQPANPADAATFDGQAVTTRFGVVQVQITVADQQITDVTLLQLTDHDRRSRMINQQAIAILVPATLAAQSADIDTVSGATYTSEGYLASLQSALDQAGLR